MKKIILLFLLYAVLVITVLGQNQGIGYQAILRNAEGDPFVNEKVTVLISLLPSADAGSALYTEFHIAETNDFGLVNLEIGRGVAQDQPFSEVDWSGGSMFIEVSIDEDDGNNFQVVGTRELLAVPYALYAANADHSVQTVSRSGDLITLSNGGGSFTDQVDDADADANNEIQDLQLDGNLLSITGNENATSIDLSAYAGSGSTLTEEEIDAFVANNGYLTSETDGDATNEIQDLELTENMLKVTNNSSATEIDLSAYLDNTDTQLTEAQVDAFANNNGYLTSFTEVDGDVTNEIQDLTLTGNELKITNNATATAINLSAYLDNTDTQLTEAQVDAFANNNGYLTSEVDGSIINEIQDLTLTGNTLKVTNNTSATDIDLSRYLDNTDTQLTEAQVDAFANNNGYLTSFTEVDGDVSNEIQDLALTGDNLTITNNASATNIDLSAYKDNTDAQTLSLTGTNLAVSGGNTIDLSSITSNSVLLTGAQSIAGEKTFSDLAKFSTIGSSGTTNEVVTDAGIAVIDGSLCPSPIPTTEGQEGCFRMSDDPNSSTSPAFPTTGDVVRINSKDFTITRTQRGGFFFYNRGADGNVVDYTGADLGAAASIITTGTLGDVVIHGKMKLTDGSTTLTFPSNDGTSGQVLTTDGSGNITFQDASTDTKLTEAEVDAFANNNGYLTSFTEVDGSVTNEIQDLNLTGDNLTITNNTSATSIDLSSYKDNTDAQTLSLSGTNLSVSGGNSVDLNPVINNSIQLSGDQTAAGVKTFTNGIKLTSITSSGASSASTTPLGVTISSIGSIPTTIGEEGTFMLAIDPSSNDTPRTPEIGETIRVNGKDFVITRITRGPFYWYEQQANGLKIEATDVGATVVKVDAASLGNILLTGTLQLTNGASTINLPNADGSAGQVLATDGSGNVTFQNATVDTKLTESEVDAFANNNGYLTSFTEVDGDATNEIQDLNLTGDNLTITNNASATNIDLSTYKDNTDAQTLSLSGSQLSISGGNNVDLPEELPATLGTAGQVLAVNSAADGVEWTTAGGGGSGVFTQSGNIISGGGSSDDFVFGTNTLTNQTGTGDDSRMWFDISNSAFRAGYTTGTQWDPSNVGFGSFATGNNNIASGSNSVAFGFTNQATAILAIALGGSNNVASGDDAIVTGYNNFARSFTEVVMGQYATDYTPSASNSTTFNETDRAFAIGNGSGPSNRSNAFTVYKNGALGLFDFSTAPTTTANRLYSVNGALHYNGSAVGSGGGGSSTNFVTETNNTHTIPSGQPDYFLNFSTINQNATVTFPASPTAGDKVTIAFQGNSGARNIAVANTHSGSFTLNSTTYSFGGLSISAGGSGSIQLIYTGSTWILMNGTISWVPI